MRTSNTIALDLIKKAIAKEPTLCQEGLKGTLPLDETTVGQVARCADFIAAFCKPIEQPDRAALSYWLKHRVEEWVDTFSDEHEYVSNGAFIAAAIGMGIPYAYDNSTTHGKCFFALSVYRVRLMKEGMEQFNKFRELLVNDTPTAQLHAIRGTK